MDPSSRIRCITKLFQSGQFGIFFFPPSVWQRGSYKLGFSVVGGFRLLLQWAYRVSTWLVELASLLATYSDDVLYVGLLPLLKSIQRPIELKKYAGETLGVDAYGWLHRGAISCAVELAQGKPTRK